MKDLRIECHRHPDIDLVARLEIGRRGPELKTRRQHTDDGERQIVKRDRLSHDAAVRAQSFAPCGVAQDDDLIPVRTILLRKKIAAQHELDA